MTYVNTTSVTAIGVLFPAVGILLLTSRYYGWRHFAPNFEIDDILTIPAAVCVEQ
jgi:hypothetical protein